MSEIGDSRGAEAEELEREAGVGGEGFEDQGGFGRGEGVDR